MAASGLAVPVQQLAETAVRRCRRRDPARAARVLALGLVAAAATVEQVGQVAARRLAGRLDGQGLAVAGARRRAVSPRSSSTVARLTRGSADSGSSVERPAQLGDRRSPARRRRPARSPAGCARGRPRAAGRRARARPRRLRRPRRRRRPAPGQQLPQLEILRPPSTAPRGRLRAWRPRTAAACERRVSSGPLGGQPPRRVAELAGERRPAGHLVDRRRHLPVVADGEGEELGDPRRRGEPRRRRRGRGSPPAAAARAARETPRPGGSCRETADARAPRTARCPGRPSRLSGRRCQPALGVHQPHDARGRARPPGGSSR